MGQIYDMTKLVLRNVILPSLLTALFLRVYSECIVLATGLKVPKSNNINAHKVFIEKEYSNGKETKDTQVVAVILTEQSLETKQMSFLGAEEQKLEIPKSIHFLVKLQQRSSPAINTCSAL